MKIQVYIRDKVVSVSCGTGAQRIRWLAEAATLRYDPNSMLSTGQPRGVKLQDGSQLGMNDRISDKLVDNARVWIVYQQILPPPDKKKQSKKK